MRMKDVVAWKFQVASENRNPPDTNRCLAPIEQFEAKNGTGR